MCSAYTDRSIHKVKTFLIAVSVKKVKSSTLAYSWMYIADIDHNIHLMELLFIVISVKRCKQTHQLNLFFLF